MRPLQAVGNWTSRRSLRTRYLVTAVLIVAGLVAGAVVASAYVATSARQSTAALLLRDFVFNRTADIRAAIAAAEVDLNRAMITPMAVEEDGIEANLQVAHGLLGQLQLRAGPAGAPVRQALQDLDNQLLALTDEFFTLVELRKDPYWVYPALPYVQGPLLQSNTEFITAARTALDEILADPATASRLRLFERFSEVRDHWRRVVLAFRALMVRFAGLGDEVSLGQESDIEDAYQIIQKDIADLLAELEAQNNFVLTDSLAAMALHSQNWYRLFSKDITWIRRSQQWRADVGFLESRIRPKLDSTTAALFAVERGITQWTAGQVHSIQMAANRISLGLWLIAALALGFVILNYTALRRSVFDPMRKVARALNAAANNETRVNLPAERSPEVSSLVRAFRAMQEQVSQRQRALEHQALHDELTGLPNRSLLADRLSHAIQVARRESIPLALLLLDLNDFKRVNDTLGHLVGDQLLVRVAARIAKVVRESDTVARLGGDEFAVLLENTGLPRARTLADRISRALEEVCVIDGHSLYTGASIGIALFPGDGEDQETLIRHADIAMYSAKRSGTETAAYDVQMDSTDPEGLALIGELRDALMTDGCELAYQPKIDLCTGEVTGAEALLRWTHSRLGPMAPERVVQMAERSGLIGSLTIWVLERAFTDYQRLAELPGHPGLAINLSPRNLQDADFADTVHELLVRFQVPSSALILEVTENAVMSDPDAVNKSLQALDRMGVGVALDDFGMGVCSLRHLKEFPVHELKIDRSFVADLLSDRSDEAIVRAIINLGHAMGLRVVAEGVEDRATLERLGEFGCDQAQGFLLAHPL
ncbi:MAG: bifunctional diguanylate cyclase/phosphodiesterase, partial [Gammaproteobacteria bacterium]|nr:bifunctional diguanylate cyclase/phosphodiesterase [Gammaproteobacteria bacterium]